MADPSLPSARSRRALLLTGDSDLRRRVELLLREVGCSVLMALDCQEALELLASRAREVRLLIADLDLPDGDGVVVGRAACAYWPHLEVLFLSSRDRDEWEREGLLPRGTSFLRKDSGNEGVVLEADRLLRRARGADPGVGCAG